MFENEKDTEQYLKSKDHREGSDAFIPYLEEGLKSVAVFDYKLN